MDKKKKKKVYLASGGAFLLIIFILISVLSSNKSTVSVQTAKVEKKDQLTSKVTASGEIRAKTSVNISPEIAGIINQLYVREGDEVKEGDLLLQIDPIQTEAEENIADSRYLQALMDVRSREIEIANTELQLERDKASLNQARAELVQKEDNYSREERSFKRKQDLHEDGLLSDDEYEIAQNSLRSARTVLDVQRENIRQMEAQIDLSKNNIEKMELSLDNTRQQERQAKQNLVKAEDNSKKTKITSPQNGVITNLAKEKGERAVPGNQNNPEATIMTIADLSVIQAELKVDETEIVGLSLHDHAEIEVDAIPDVKFEGEVTEIGNSPISGTSQQEAKDFKVIVTLKDPSKKLRPGMSCTSDITTERREGVLAIPIQALTIREVEVDENGEYQEPDLDSRSEKTVVAANSKSDETPKKELEGVFVIDEKMRARFRPIKTGITGESDIEVLENLKEGEEIITGSFQTLRTIKDGTFVKIVNKKESESD
jgi:HlyD family secretion protein